jgi:hypothetical protein
MSGLPPRAYQSPKSLLRERRGNTASHPFKQEMNCGAFVAISASVLRSSNPSTAAFRGVAHFFLKRKAASLAGWRRTDEASRPTEANRLPGHPASFVRSVRTVGSPQVLLRGSLSVLLIGSIPWPKRSRSGTTIQVLFYAPQMWRVHGIGRKVSALGTPARSCLRAAGASPAAAKRAVTVAT